MNIIKNIISEEINNYVNYIISEKKMTKNQEDYEKAKVRDGNNIGTSDEKRIRRIITTDDIINVAALARKVYPNHTPEGAQSQLRKKLKGLNNDNGSEYHIKEREANVIQKEIGDL